jgi:hypothetical protein
MVFKVPNDTLATVDTHNNSLDPTPSSDDIASAKNHHTNIYVVSQNGLYAIDPSGKVTQPYSSTSDLINKKKKAN